MGQYRSLKTRQDKEDFYHKILTRIKRMCCERETCVFVQLPANLLHELVFAVDNAAYCSQKEVYNTSYSLRRKDAEGGFNRSCDQCHMEIWYTDDQYYLHITVM